MAPEAIAELTLVVIDDIYLVSDDKCSMLLLLLDLAAVLLIFLIGRGLLLLLLGVHVSWLLLVHLEVSNLSSLFLTLGMVVLLLALDNDVVW